jgi:hypothetical protein
VLQPVQQADERLVSRFERVARGLKDEDPEVRVAASCRLSMSRARFDCSVGCDEAVLAADLRSNGEGAAPSAGAPPVDATLGVDEADDGFESPLDAALGGGEGEGGFESPLDAALGAYGVQGSD